MVALILPSAVLTQRKVGVRAAAGPEPVLITWCEHPASATAASAGFVAAMEDVLEVYHRPHDPDRPVVCVDETLKQLIAEGLMLVLAAGRCSVVQPATDTLFYRSREPAYVEPW